MVPGLFSVIVDHEQSRVQSHPIIAVVKGRGFDGDVFDDAWIDPITNTAMLRPMCKYTAWGSSNSGIYARPAIGAYEFKTSASWVAKEQIVGAGEFMEAALADEWARTATAPGKNRGINLAFFGYGAGEYGLIAECGWDDTATTATGSAVGLKVYSNGQVVVYRDGVYQGEGSIGVSVSQSKNIPWELMLLPMRKRELLILGASNEGFTVVFDEILETDTNPTITPAEKFWFKPVSTADKVQVQISPLKFEGSGFVTSTNINFTLPPATGAVVKTWSNPVFSTVTNASIYGDKAYAGTTDITPVVLTEEDGTTTFVADDTLATARLNVTMTGDGNYTPFLYGAVYQFDGETALTNDTEQGVLDDYITGLTIEVPDDPWGARANIVITEPDAVDAIISGIKVQGNRPGQLKCGDLVLIDRAFGEPAIVEGIVDEARSLSIPLYDLTDKLRAYQFRDEYPFDGYYLSRSTGNPSAIKEILQFAGVSTPEMGLTHDAFLVPEIPGKTAEEFSFSIPVGDDAQQAIEALHQKFVPDWFIGMRPTATVPQFWFKSPADMGTTPKLTLYEKRANALAASKPATQVYSSLKYEAEEVNANYLIVIGRDPRTGQILQSYVVDSASQNTTTVPSLRPDNWLGEPKIFGVADDRLRRQSDCDKLATALVPLVMSKRTFGEFETPEMVWYNSDPGVTDVMLPLWRGDYVTIEGYGDVQITSLSVTVLLNVEGKQVTRARYTFGGFTNAGGTTLGEIQQKNSAKFQAGLTEFFSIKNNLAWQRVRRQEAP